MIFRSRRLDIAVKVLALVLLSLTLALSLRNVAYALAPGQPLELAGPAALLAAPPADRYVGLTAQADTREILTYFRYGVRYYYFPVQGGDGSLFARTLNPPHQGATLRLEGRLQRFDAVAFAAQVREAYAATYGHPLPAQAWIVLQDESPAAYAISLVAWGPLLIAWVVILYLLIRRLQNKPALPGRRLLTTDKHG